MLVLDTCALIWWSLAPDKLPPAAADACRRMEDQGGYLSSISIWEVGLKVKKGKLDLGLPFDDYVARIKRTGVLEIIPIDEVIWMENLALPWPHPDPADRTIVATAALRGLPIVTSDEPIRAFYPNCLW